MEMWGCQPTSEAEVRSVFSSYYGPPDNSVRRLPWRDSQPDQESQEDLGRLEQFSREGFLAINFLPAANCVDSSDQARGWGTRPGYVFQVRQHQRRTSSLPARSTYYCSESLPGALHLGGEDRCSVRDCPGLPWCLLPGRQQSRPREDQHRPPSPDCSHLGSLQRRGGCPAHRGGPRHLQALGQGGLQSLGVRLGSLV